MSGVLHIRLLGDFRIAYLDKPIVGLASPRLQSLLAYLLLHRDALTSRQQLAFLFWPDSSEAQALTNLRKLLYLLHQALPELQQFLLEERRGLRWRPGTPCSLDIDLFEAAMRQAQRAAQSSDEAGLRLALEQAVDIYKGDLLPTCYEDWIFAAREEFHRSFFVGLDRLIDLLEKNREWPAAITQTKRLLQQDPLQEATYRRLLKLHALNGDRNSVHRTYQACVKILKREFDAMPTPATQLLYKQLTAQSELLPAPPDLPAVSTALKRPCTNVSLPPTSFLGRDQEQETVLRLLRQPSVRLLTVTGPPGVGKTRLAAEAALRLLGELPNGVFFVDLAQLTDPAQVPAAIAESIDLPANEGRTLPERLKRFLQDQRVLLLLDNFEHLLPAAPPLADLLGTCPNLKLLITSRTPLHLRGENELRLRPLPLPGRGHALTAEQLGEYAAIQLFVGRAQGARPEFMLTEYNVAAIAEIARRLDGLPLAIEWAAARVRYLPPDVILAQLDNRLKLLVQGARDLPDRQQSLRGAVAWSYDLLTNGEQALFRCMAVFRGGCGVEAAEAVCNPGNELSTDLQDELCVLVDKGLLSQEARAAVDRPALRFDMLQTIRDYALERLEESGEAAMIRDRYAAYYLNLQSQVETLLRESAASLSAARLALEYDNIRAAQEWTAQRSNTDMA